MRTVYLLRHYFPPSLSLSAFHDSAQLSCYTSAGDWPVIWRAFHISTFNYWHQIIRLPLSRHFPLPQRTLYHTVALIYQMVSTLSIQSDIPLGPEALLTFRSSNNLCISLTSTFISLGTEYQFTSSNSHSLVKGGLLGEYILKAFIHYFRLRFCFLIYLTVTI